MKEAADLMPSADWLQKVVTMGPPALLVIALAVILSASARGKLPLKNTLALSGIAGGFFILWILAIPQLSTRHIFIEASTDPEDLLQNWSLQPIHYRFGTLADSALANADFVLPDGRDPVRVNFDLKSLLLSYRSNINTVIQVAKDDPVCFDQATRGRDYTQVAASLRKQCPGALKPLAPPFP